MERRTRKRLAQWKATSRTLQKSGQRPDFLRIKLKIRAPLQMILSRSPGCTSQTLGATDSSLGGGSPTPSGGKLTTPLKNPRSPPDDSVNIPRMYVPDARSNGFVLGRWQPNAEWQKNSRCLIRHKKLCACFGVRNCQSIRPAAHILGWCWIHAKRQNFQRYLIRRKCFCAKSGALVNAGQFFRSCGTAFSKK